MMKIVLPTIHIISFFMILAMNGALPSVVLANNTMRGVYKASSFAGKIVKGVDGKDLGVIEEIVITHTGEVAYAVLSFGGFLGLGDKLFAIPWTALSHRPDGEYLTMNILPEKLAKAPGFNKNDWPDMGDENWKSEIWNFYEPSVKQTMKKKTNKN